MSKARFFCTLKPAQFCAELARQGVTFEVFDNDREILVTFTGGF